MSDYHVMRAAEDGGTIDLVFHVPVPDENNAAGVNLRTCLVEDEGVVKESIVTWIETAEQTALSAGELLEYPYILHTHKDVPSAVKAAKIEELFTAGVPVVQEQLRQKYIYWHYNGNVA